MRTVIWQRCHLLPFSCILVLALASASAVWAQTAGNSQSSLQSATPSIPELPATTAPPPAMLITIEQAIEFAKKNNPTLQANRTLINQNQEQEVTANLRPNPVLAWDAQFLPIFTPTNFN